MDRKAVPAELAVVFVELERLLGVGQGLEADVALAVFAGFSITCLLYTSPSPRD